MLIDLEKKLIKKAAAGLVLTFTSLAIAEFFLGNEFISLISLIVLGWTIVIIFKISKEGPIRNSIFWGIIALILYFSILCHYYSVDFQYVIIFALILVYSSILFKGLKIFIIYSIILVLYTVLMYLLRENIYFVKSPYPDTSSIILSLRIFSYLLILYFLYALFVYYRDKNQLFQLQKEIEKDGELASSRDIKELFDAISRKDNSFMPLFLKYYPNFMPAILSINPQISNNEVEVCALLKLGLTTNEIAIATNSSYKAIESARFRIRKKLNLNTRDNLTAYFNSLS
ncbi:helix-turn-helix transcriptional regulator [Chryseobacterium sp. CT-SW4]|uniref:helix-turn-helix transcriptional regulator n=1 Tax=Chryseobacterium sp. SW-1 TaxID=3157343 RepID=UPI003B024B85